MLCLQYQRCLDINDFFKAYRFSSSDQFIKTFQHLERHLTTCNEIVIHVFPKNVCQLRQTLFDKLYSFKIPYSDDQKFPKNMAIFDFESVCAQKDNLWDTDIATWIGKHLPIYLSISSNLIDQLIRFCTSNPEALVEPFVDALDGLATQSKAQMKTNFSDIDTSVKSKLYQYFSSLDQHHCRKEPVLEFEDVCIREEGEQDVSTQFLQTQKSQNIGLRDLLEKYCNVFSVFGFNCAKYDFKIIKGFLFPLLVNGRGIEPIVISKANQWVFFTFGVFQMLERLKFLGATTSPNSFAKAYKTSKTKD